METHLKINHLTPYSDYELLFLANNEIWQLTTIEFKSNYPIWANNYWNEKKLYFFPEINKKDARSGQGFKLKKIKPILRPLSDLTKEIEINGKKFVPINELKCSWETLSINNRGRLEIYIDRRYEDDFECLPYAIINKLLEWHFDFLGLIEQELAIDINTIK